MGRQDRGLFKLRQWLAALNRYIPSNTTNFARASPNRSAGMGFKSRSEGCSEKNSCSHSVERRNPAIRGSAIDRWFPSFDGMTTQDKRRRKECGPAFNRAATFFISLSERRSSWRP
jgi:hypothetical protein